jgi:GntR family transcriptional repressor for pyruvate dehydrogenase complex
MSVSKPVTDAAVLPAAHRPAAEVRELSWLPAKTGTLSENIARQIRAALFADRLRPGDFIGGEASLAVQFGCSRMAVRDALRGLSAAGIVEIRKGAGGGVRVSRANPDLFADALAVQLKLLGAPISDVLDAQIASEVATAELAAERASAEDVARMSMLLDRAEALADPIDFTAVVRDFHVALAESSRSLVLTTLLKGVMQVMILTYGPNTTPERAKGVVARYRQVVEAIAARDPDAARLRMRDHLRSVRANLVADGVLPSQ